MRQISADLQAVQLVRSPRARVTCTVEARGQNEQAPALEWAEVVPNAGQSVFRPVTAVGLADGRILKFVAFVGALAQYTVSNPHIAGSWSGLTPVVLQDFTMLGLAAIREPGTSTLWLLYIDNSNNVVFQYSVDNGTSWAAPSALYSGGNATGDLVAAWYPSVGPVGLIFGFSTFNGGTGQYTPRFGYYVEFVGWVTVPYEADWRAAGFITHQPSSTLRCLVFRARGKGPSRIRRVDLTSGAFAYFDEIDQTQAGLFGLELSYARYCHLCAIDVTMGVIGEGAHGAGIALGVGGVWLAPAIALTDEPIMLPSIAAVNSQPYACLCDAGSGATADVYLVGDTVVWRGARQAATSDVLEAVRYTYDEGSIEIEFGALIDPLYVGQILVVTRTLSWGSQSGSESFRAIIIRVEHASDKVVVLAADALGWLGTARCHRPHVINDGTAPGVLTVMSRLAARFGIAVSSDNLGLSTAAVMPFTLAPAESLAGAAFRVGSQSEYYLLPANDGSFSLTMMVPGASVSGDYANVAHDYGQAPSQQPIARAAIISDYRVLAFSYVLGTYSTDPEDGAAVAMARGPVVANTRPISYSLTNSRYNTTARVRAAATAEVMRQDKLAVTAVIEGQANLALEVFDRVEVVHPIFGSSVVNLRVRRIDERYDRGRLWQVIYLGPA